MPADWLSTGVIPTWNDFHQFTALLQRWNIDSDSEGKTTPCNTAAFATKAGKATAKQDRIANYISKQPQTCSKAKGGKPDRNILL